MAMNANTATTVPIMATFSTLPAVERAWRALLRAGFTRKTNAYSKKCRGHALAVALMMLHYNLIRARDTIGTAPAIAAGIMPRPWTLGNGGRSAGSGRPKPNGPKHYRKRAA